MHKYLNFVLYPRGQSPDHWGLTDIAMNLKFYDLSSNFIWHKGPTKKILSVKYILRTRPFVQDGIFFFYWIVLAYFVTSIYFNGIWFLFGSIIYYLLYWPIKHFVGFLHAIFAAWLIFGQYWNFFHSHV